MITGCQTCLTKRAIIFFLTDNIFKLNLDFTFDSKAYIQIFRKIELMIIVNKDLLHIKIFIS